MLIRLRIMQVDMYVTFCINQCGLSKAGAHFEIRRSKWIHNRGHQHAIRILRGAGANWISFPHGVFAPCPRALQPPFSSQPSAAKGGSANVNPWCAHMFHMGGVMFNAQEWKRPLIRQRRKSRGRV